MLSVRCFAHSRAKFSSVTAKTAAGFGVSIRSSPVAFWTGGEQALKNTIKDAAGYNREMGVAFRWYGLGWLLDAIGAAFSPTVGLAVMAALCTLGLFLLWRRYRQLLSKYS